MTLRHNSDGPGDLSAEPLAPQNLKSHDPDVDRIVRLCDTHNIPLATNLATAEMVIKSLDRGESRLA